MRARPQIEENRKTYWDYIGLLFSVRYKDLRIGELVYTGLWKYGLFSMAKSMAGML